MPLTDTAIRNATSGQKARRLFDGGGLYLEVSPRGSKWWRLKYRFNGKEKRLALGVYPEVRLSGYKDKATGEWVDGARDKRDKARRLLAEGIDPGEARKAQKAAQGATESFEAIAREWFAKFSPNWALSHSDKVIGRLEKDVFPYLGKRPIQEIGAPELLAVLRRVEARGAIETAHRAKRYAGRIFRYAVATGRAVRDPTGDLAGALPPPRKRRLAAITDPMKVGELLRAMEAYTGSTVVRAALRLSALLFVRPGELRRAEWAEFDLPGGQWVIPAEKMKMKSEHIVPLSRQAITILEDLYLLTGNGRYVFPGARSRARPLSENGPRTALRAMGYTNEEMTPHGFRAMASTLLNEQGWRADVIERQLAHTEQNKVRAAYHRAEYLDERRKMMQAWADYLDGLTTGADVVALRKKV